MTARVRDQNRERNAERWTHYLVCKERGHKPSGLVTAGIPPMRMCKFCGSYFWTECVDRESMIPTDPEEWPND